QLGGTTTTAAPHGCNARPPPRSLWRAGSATLTTLASRNATNDPRMQAARMSRLRVAGDRCSILANEGEVAVADYQIVKLADVDDWRGDYPGEMRGITYAIGA